jgi:hypothetical protein
MNKKRRENLRFAASLLDRAGEIVYKCLDEESDCMSNLEGTSLENTERYGCMEDSCDYMERACDKIDSAKDNLYNAMS